jgi:hypothetical protein
MNEVNIYDELAIRTLFKQILNFQMPIFLKYIAQDIIEDKDIDLDTIDFKYFFGDKMSTQNGMYITDYQKDKDNIYTVNIFAGYIEELWGTAGDLDITFSFDGKTITVITTKIGYVMDCSTMQNNNLLILELKKELNKNDDSFLISFYINMSKFNVGAEYFLRAIDGVGELPETISRKDKKDIENIVFIFKNIEDILSIEIIDNNIKEVLNDILMNSFESEIIDYNTFLNNLINNIANLYSDERQKDVEEKTPYLYKGLVCLKNNISIIKETDNNIKEKLTKIIISKTIKLAHEEE